jgi:hypothetical protein
MLVALATGVAGGLTACTPVRVITGAYPSRFKRDGDLDDRILRAFVATVIPGIGGPDPNLVRAFADRAYPFAKYRAFFCSDLSARGGKLCGSRSFDELGATDRTAVVQDGLKSDAITRRLYAGAVFLAQIAVYSGIYDDAHGAPIIDFDGRYRFAGLDAVTYPQPEMHLAHALTSNGNPA